MNAEILEILVFRRVGIDQRHADIKFEARIAEQLPVDTDTDTQQLGGIAVGSIGVPTSAGIDKGCNGDASIIQTIGETWQSETSNRYLQAKRDNPAIVEDQLILPIAAHRVATANADTFDRKERIGRELDVTSEGCLPVT